MTFLSDRLATTEGETVSYSRPGVFAPRSITAVLSTPAVAVDGSDQKPARVEAGRMDFIIRTSDVLSALGAGIVPQKGDRIDRTVNGFTHRYTVVIDNSTPAWEYSEPENLTMRVRARLVEII
jgi:hypothetical protein